MEAIYPPPRYDGRTREKFDDECGVRLKQGFGRKFELVECSGAADLQEIDTHVLLLLDFAEGGTWTSNENQETRTTNVAKYVWDMNWSV